MGTLETIMEMQRNGMTNTQISTVLQQQGIAPREINDALNQAQIKNAINAPTQPNVMQETQNPQTQQMNTPMQQTAQPNFNTQQPMSTQTQQTQPQNFQQQPTQQQNFQQQQQNFQQQPTQQQETYDQNYYPETPQSYDDTQAYAQQGYLDNETITQIAEQVTKEQFKEYKKKTGDIATFKSYTEDKIKELDDRLKRIENTIDKLQQAIIQKIGEFGENTQSIKKDISNLHNTTSKLMNPLIDNYKELQKLTHKRK